ncbi:ABC transporter permease [Corynebacterium sp. 320]|uniref:ABC transporter permease n=1 Tax=Corynebacterium TaxID=1716 RepID=UPI00125CA98D|nr:MULTISPECIES: ABC transporter permease [Corynebacterium]KAB1503158.1 ABC transporter permease [Corynebacterium sp. 320]KAB1550628.1 ABC transporter permease [Corynebacterium sp. 321]KAB1550990.1 ABC transporter permease [Corynebacterium sp. 319]KAB3526955.1 ABC transporter permease [Corynebacterium sp. 250]KAB3538448.1 ABC transporter permease [Corynebacterium sp. 366]
MRDDQELAAVARLRSEHPDAEHPNAPRAVRADARRLTKHHTHVTLRSYLRQMWRYRKFTYLNARYRAIADNDDMFLGRLWTILEPLLRIAMYGVLFGVVLNTSRGIENFVGFLIIGIIFFSTLSKGLTNGSGLIQRSRALLRTFNFPRASLVLGESLRYLLMSLIPAALAVAAALAFQHEEPLHWTIVLVIPIFLLMNLFALGLSFATARLTAFIPDAKKLIFYVNRAWFYVSGIFFSIERFDAIPRVRNIMEHNPAYIFLDSLRHAIMYGNAPSLERWSTMVLWTLAVLIIGFLYFWRGESQYARVR